MLLIEPCHSTFIQNSSYTKRCDICLPEAAIFPNGQKDYLSIVQWLSTESAQICTIIDLCFAGADVPDLTPEDVKLYIRYIADRRLLGLGLKKIFGSDKNPLDWLDYMLNGVEHANFFENRATEYSKASTTGNWQDIFK